MYRFGILKENVDLKNYNTYQIGGIAKYLIIPNDLESLKKLIMYLKDNNINYLVLGKGSNVILPDEDYNGVIILLDKLNSVEINDINVEVQAGIILSKFIKDLIDKNLGGLENLYGIPGTLGGAIRGNAGCYGSVISDYLESVTYLENNEIKTINKDECNFCYRDSIFKGDNNKIIISATFKLFKSDREHMNNIIKENMLKRKINQPLEFPNAGSVFRNPIDNSAGKLIEEAGLKNFNINGAYISDKHANFIINKDNASSADIIELIRKIQEEVKNKYNIELILEQEIVKY